MIVSRRQKPFIEENRVLFSPKRPKEAHGQVGRHYYKFRAHIVRNAAVGTGSGATVISFPGPQRPVTELGLSLIWKRKRHTLQDPLLVLGISFQNTALSWSNSGLE